MKANLRKKCCRYLITFLSAIAVTAGLLIPAQIKAADSYDKDKKGSITINLDDVKLDDTVTNKEGVSVSVYQIASINHDRINISFDINSSLSSTGVDVNDITTSDKNLNAAKKLSATIGKSGITATTKKTDRNGKVSFTNLPQGMYLVEEADGASYGTFSPFLVAIPYMEDGENWIYDVVTYTKGVSNKQGSLEVTKYLAYMTDGTYYVFETDENGKPYIMGDSHTEQYDRTYKCVIGDGKNNSTDNKIQLEGHPKANLKICNMFAEIPDGFLVEAELSIKKNVVKNGQQTTTNDTFYASVYEQTGTSDNLSQTLIQTVQLKQNDTVTVALPVDADTSKTKTFVIEETDANGNALDSDNFAYEISGEGNVELSMENTKGSITLTNTIKEEESESSSEEETTSTEKEKEKHTPNTTSRTSTGGKTGDTTPIKTWIIIGVVAAAVIIFLIIRKKKSE